MPQNKQMDPEFVQVFPGNGLEKSDPPQFFCVHLRFRTSVCSAVSS
jgi:hypothetical protein